MTSDTLLTEAELAKIERKLGCVLPEASREYLRDIRRVGFQIDWFQRSLRRDMFDVADKLVKHGGAVERAIAQAADPYVLGGFSWFGEFQLNGKRGSLAEQIECLEQLRQELRSLLEAARRVQTLHNQGKGRGTKWNFARAMVVRFLSLAYEELDRSRPTVAEFAKTVWPHLHIPTRCRSSSALADALNEEREARSRYGDMSTMQSQPSTQPVRSSIILN